MGSSRPSFHYNSVTNRWELSGKGGVLKLAIPDANTAITSILAAVASNAAIAALGSYSSNVGSLLVTGARVGDTVIATPKTAPPTNVFVCNAMVSGSNNVNFRAVNVDIAVVASYPAMGWDVMLLKYKA